MVHNTLKLKLSSYRNILIIIVVPLILVPVLFIGQFVNDHDNGQDESQRNNQKYHCIYCICVIAIFWFTEALPLAITSFLPLVLFPLFGVLDTRKVAESYLTESSMMFIGGLILAMSLETSGLHLRIALKMMQIIGGSQTRLLLGMMFTAAFCSMWISNTATTAMLAPIALVFVDQLNQDDRSDSEDSIVEPAAAPRRISIRTIEASQPNGFHVNSIPDKNMNIRKRTLSVLSDKFRIEDTSKERLQLKKLYLLALCYAAKIGGLGAITGSPPNLVFREIISSVDIAQNGTYLDITFSTWMALNIPGVILNLLVTWAYLWIAFKGLPRNLFKCFKKGTTTSNANAAQKAANKTEFTKIIEAKQKELGSATLEEGIVALLFLTIVILWFTRDFLWVKLFYPTVVSDSTSTMLVLSFMFVIPKDFSDFSKGTILDWKYVQANLAWDSLLIFGAGFAISNACISSGLSETIGDAMYHFKELPGWVMMTIIMLIVTFATELISNNACASLFIPLLISMSKSLDLHPLYLTVPATVACTFAFMLPSGSPGNTLIIAASNGDLTVMDMVKNGLFLNFSCVIVFVLVNITYGNLLFKYDDYTYPST